MDLLYKLLMEADDSLLTHLYNTIFREKKMSMEPEGGIKRQLPNMLDELYRCGGTTIANYFSCFRGRAPDYKSIVCDVAEKYNVRHSELYDSVEDIEGYILDKLFDDVMSGITRSELTELADNLGYKFRYGRSTSRHKLIRYLDKIWMSQTKEREILLATIVNEVVKKFTNQDMSNVMGRAVLFASSVLRGPIGWVFTAFWSVFEFAHPKYSVTIPAVIQIAYIRHCVNSGNSLPYMWSNTE